MKAEKLTADMPKYMRERNRRLIDSGLCVDCRQPNDRPGMWLCSECTKRRSREDWERKEYHKTKERNKKQSGKSSRL